MDLEKNGKKLLEIAKKINEDIEDYLFAYSNDYKEIIENYELAKLNYINIIEHYGKRFKKFAEKNNCKFRIFHKNNNEEIEFFMIDKFGNNAEIYFSNLDKFIEQQKIFVKQIKILI